jgi:hypothetical protein
MKNAAAHRHCGVLALNDGCEPANAAMVGDATVVVKRIGVRHRAMPRA